MNKFIADLHFGHSNVISFDNRPFLTIEEHDRFIVENWNKNVDSNDDVYILGDVSFLNITDTINIISKLNGRLHLIAGNHDKELVRASSFVDLFVEVLDYKELYLSKDRAVVLSHYPIPCFRNHYYGWYHLYGHVHTSFEYNMMENIKFQMENLYTTPCKMMNVGAMMPYINYIPRTLEEIFGRKLKHEKTT